MNRKIVLVFLAILLLTAAAIAQAQSGSGGPYGGPGLAQTTFIADKKIDIGTVSMWNTPKKLQLRVDTEDGWLIRKIEIYVGYPEIKPLPITRSGNPIPGKFPYRQAFRRPVDKHALVLDLKDDLGFSWGSQYTELRAPTIAVHAEVVKVNAKARPSPRKRPGPSVTKPSRSRTARPGAGTSITSWRTPNGAISSIPKSLASAIVVRRKKVSRPTRRAKVVSSTSRVKRLNSQSVPLSSERPKRSRKTSPLDLFQSSDTTESPRFNVARLLQSLDDDHSDGKINIRHPSCRLP